MLVLSRNNKEKIILTKGVDEITITVFDIRNDSVRVGVEAPSEFKIVREEIRSKVEKTDCSTH